MTILHVGGRCRPFKTPPPRRDRLKPTARGDVWAQDGSWVA
jgi:hypothetical protein